MNSGAAAELRYNSDKGVSPFHSGLSNPLDFHQGAA